MNGKIRYSLLVLLKENETLTLPRVLVGLKNEFSENLVAKELNELVKEEIIAYEGGLYHLIDGIDYDLIIEDLNALVAQKDGVKNEEEGNLKRLFGNLKLLLLITLSVSLLFNILGTYLVFALGGFMVALLFNIIGLIGCFLPTFIYGMELPKKDTINTVSFALMAVAVVFYIIGVIVSSTASTTAGAILGSVAIASQITVLVFAILNFKK